MEWSEVLHIIGDVGVIGLLVFIVFQTFFGKIGENLADIVTKKELTEIERKVIDRYDRELKMFEALLDKNKISFTKIYDKRFEVLVELFNKLQYLHGYMAEWTARIKPIMEGEDYEQVAEKQLTDVTKAIHDFRNFCLLNRIFFDKSFNEYLQELNKEVWTKYFVYGYNKDIIKDEYMNRGVKQKYIKEIYDISLHIEEEFPKHITEVEKRIKDILHIVDEAVKNDR